MLLTLLKFFAAPGTPGFLAMTVAIGLVAMFVWPRNRRLGRLWLIGVAATHIGLAMPVVANAIAEGLPRVPGAASAGASRVNMLIVLDGDNRRGRARIAAEFYAKDPLTIWVLGDSWIMVPLIESGIPSYRISLDTNTATTREQMVRVGQLMAGRPERDTAVVASRLQLPRIAALAAIDHLSVQLVPSPVDIEPPVSGLLRFVPTYVAMRVSRDALYEHAALAYYRWRGWI
jgi:uncharacterized SAM-binding protein YcdF (DUF218 family)